MNPTDLCACGKPATHVNARPDDADWACRVPAVGVSDDARAAGLKALLVDNGWHKSDGTGVWRANYKRAVDLVLEAALPHLRPHRVTSGENPEAHGADCPLCGGLGGIAVHMEWSERRGKPLWTAHEYPSDDPHPTYPCPYLGTRPQPTLTTHEWWHEMHPGYPCEYHPLPKTAAELSSLSIAVHRAKRAACPDYGIGDHDCSEHEAVAVRPLPTREQIAAWVTRTLTFEHFKDWTDEDFADAVLALMGGAEGPVMPRRCTNCEADTFACTACGARVEAGE